MERTTKADIQYSFERWLGLVNGKTAQSYQDIGGYQLDNNAIYGGVRIEQIVNAHGAVHDVTRRMKPAQFCEAVYFMEQSLSK